ncbi:MAG: acyltransferase family protein [Salinivirgaceae bacterium]|nr:acyltransferase family protein [Salinivirgaceae bacterium]
METDKKRIEFIDLAKGVCIILVVLLHMGLPIDEHVPLLQNLRMPLYFILSGLFFKTYGGFAQLCKKKINKILIPFVFFYVASYGIFYMLITFAPSLSNSEATGILDIFTQRTTFNNPIWFLLCLFWCNLLFCAISVTTKEEWQRTIAVITIGASGYLLNRCNVQIYGCIDCAFSSLPMFYVGYMLNKTKLLYSNKFDKYTPLFAAAILCLALLLVNIWPSRINYQTNEYFGNIIIAYSTSILVVLSTLLICKIIKHLPIISYFGRYSIIVLCTHEMIRKFVKPVLGILTDNVYVLAVVVLTICLAIIPLCIRFLPHVTAQKDVLAS